MNEVALTRCATPARRPFWLALLVSLMLHLSAITAPGWGLPLLDDEEAQTTLDATLVVPVQAKPRLPPKPAPAPQKKRSAPFEPVSAPAGALAMPAAEGTESAAPVNTQPESASAVASEALSDAVPLASTIAHASLWPKQGRITYQVTRGENGFLIGRAEHRWQHDEQSYELRAVTETVGLAALFRPVQVVQESRGLFAATGLQPLEFKNERDGKLKDSVRFDMEQRRIFLGNGQSAALGASVQDLLSLFYQLGAAALDVTEFTMTVATGRKVANYLVTVGETLKLDTPLGERSVRHLKVAGTARDDATEIWFDTLTHLPMKIRHRDRKGEVFDQIATAIELEKTE
jgi:hypothetical protein